MERMTLIIAMLITAFSFKAQPKPLVEPSVTHQIVADRQLYAEHFFNILYGYVGSWQMPRSAKHSINGLCCSIFSQPNIYDVALLTGYKGARHQDLIDNDTSKIQSVYVDDYKLATDTTYSEAIQSALNAASGKRVQFSASKTYTIDKAIVVPSNTVIEGNYALITMSAGHQVANSGYFKTVGTAPYYQAAVSQQLKTNQSYIINHNAAASMSTGDFIEISGDKYYDDCGSLGCQYFRGVYASVTKISGDTVNFSNPVDTAFTTTIILGFKGSENITVNRLNFNNAQANDTSTYINAGAVRNLNINNCSFNGNSLNRLTSAYVGIYLQGLNCSINDCYFANMYHWGMQVAGHNIIARKNRLYNNSQGFITGDRRYQSNGIIYEDCFGNSAKQVVFDFHGNTNGGIYRCTVNTTYSYGMSIRSGKVNVIDCTINIDNSISQAPFVYGIAGYETFDGNAEWRGNKINVLRGPSSTGINCIAISSADSIGLKNFKVNNNVSNNGQILINPPMNGSDISGNSLSSDDQQQASISINSKSGTGNTISKNTIYNNIPVGTYNYAMILGATNGTFCADVNNNTTIVRYGVANSQFRVGGSFNNIHDNTFFSTTTSPNIIILDLSTAKQNLFNNNFQNHAGIVSPICYTALPSASAYFIGRQLQLNSAGTVNTYICLQTGSGVFAWQPVGWLKRPSATRSSSATLALTYGADYVFTGSTATYTLPATSSTSNSGDYRIYIKNAGTGNLTVNTSGGASVIYDSALVNSLTVAPGVSVTLTPDGTYFQKN